MSQFTLRGQGHSDTPSTLIQDFSRLELSDSSELMAIPWELPNAVANNGQLACLLLCKGVTKSKVNHNPFLGKSQYYYICFSVVYYSMYFSSFQE